MFCSIVFDNFIYTFLSFSNASFCFLFSLYSLYTANGIIGIMLNDNNGLNFTPITINPIIGATINLDILKNAFPKNLRIANNSFDKYARNTPFSSFS